MVDATSLLALARVHPARIALGRQQRIHGHASDIVYRVQCLVMAVHMYMSGKGYMLKASGEKADAFVEGWEETRGHRDIQHDEEGGELRHQQGQQEEKEEGKEEESMDEMDALEGWDALEDVYGFLYKTGDGKYVYVKCIYTAPYVNVQQAYVGMEAPVQMRCGSAMLDVDMFVKEEYDRESVGYKNMDGFIEVMDACGKEMEGVKDTTVSRVPLHGNAMHQDDYDDGGEWGKSGHDKRGQEGRMDQEQEDEYGVRDTRVGYGDVVPPGCIAPGTVRPEGGGRGRLGEGGGMVVGPDHPIFGPRRMHDPSQTEEDMRRGGLPPGARWDPIRPPGMPGFHPGDFQHQQEPRRQPHPDIMQPGRGTGTNWDSFFG